MDMLDARIVDAMAASDATVAVMAAVSSRLSLRVVRRPDGVPPTPMRFELAEAGTTIGRSPGCDLVLDDPFRMVSRRHAWLAPQGGGQALLRCISSGVEMRVNNQVVPPGGECVVAGGDCLDIGGFVLLLEAPGVAPAAHAGTAPALLARRPRLDQWFNLDSAADPLGPQSPLPAAIGQVLAASPAAAPSVQRPIDPPPRAPVHEDRSAPAVPAVAAHTTAMRPMPKVVPAQALLEAAALARPTAPAFLRAPDERPAPADTGRASAPPATAPMAAAAADSHPAALPMMSGDLPAAWREALLRGAGLDPATPVELNTATMERLGALLRTTTDGTLELLRSRALAKRSIRAEGTLIAARSNNPLKFTPDAAEALAMLLAPKGLPGFMPPVPALQQAYDDLQIHQLAMLAGMRAALHDMVAKLGPQATEADEGPAQGLARHVPVLRDAALWRRHQGAYERMQGQLDDVFEATFGREFVKAYEAQAKLAAQGPATPPDPA
ncbi:type VI secretion system FHA domain protein [Burkholderiales bacterium JOSHI_001]|nr:type VI secretion system FHA domain protein [Burkholderiales bacterium JOSHI_001]